MRGAIVGSRGKTSVSVSENSSVSGDTVSFAFFKFLRLELIRVLGFDIAEVFLIVKIF
jgi:hypothetical protein